MKPIASLFPLLALTAALPSGAAAEGELEIVATAATAVITPSGKGRRPVDLPSLRYSFHLLHECASSFIPQSLTLTIADSHRFLGKGELEGARGVARVSLDIPASQLAPVILSDFCAATDAAEGDTGTALKTMPSLLSAAASLQCASAAGQRTIYSVAPLDVVLVCKAVPSAAQEASAASGR